MYDVHLNMTSNFLYFTGIVADGATDTVLMSTAGQTDRDYELDKWSVTAQFNGYTSHLNGMARFDWAVGTTPGGEEVMPFSVLGIQHDEAETSVPGDGEHCVLFVIVTVVVVVGGGGGVAIAVVVVHFVVIVVVRRGGKRRSRAVVVAAA